MSAHHVAILISDRFNSYVIYIHPPKHVSSNSFLVLFLKLIVSLSRHNELELTWLSAINVVISVKERPITYKSRHFKPLMYNLKSTVFINWDNGNLFVIFCQYFLVMIEEINELIRKHSVNSHLTKSKWDVVCPLLKNYQPLFFIFIHDRNLALIIEESLCLIK